MRVEARYCGTVTGVGFRYTAYTVARAFDITGWVKNMPDSSVMLVAQGEPLAVWSYLQALEGRMSGLIARKEYNESSQEEPITSFEIRYGDE